VNDARILIVDDDEQVARLTARVLDAGGFSCDLAFDAARARSALAEREYALILCDMDMPGESGLDLVRFAHERHPETAAVFLSGLDDRALAAEALGAGAYGYVIKPFRANELLINVANALRRRALEREFLLHRRRLEVAVAERMRELEATLEQLRRSELELSVAQEETIHLLSIAAETRDAEMGRHIERMGAYSALLARLAGLDHQRCDLLRLAAPLHDIGKIGVEDSVLRKPGPLNDLEQRAMDRHTLIGYELLAGSRSPLLQLAATIALTHHERIDGLGKPLGVAGAEIPVEGRIAAVADVFDALTSDRCYRAALPLDEALEVLRSAAGTQLDAELVELLVTNVDDFVLVGEDVAQRRAA